MVITYCNTSQFSRNSVQLHVLSHEGTSTWSVVKAEGKGPSPRDKLSSAVIGDKIYVFGGFGPQSPEDVSTENHKTESKNSRKLLNLEILFTQILLGGAMSADSILPDATFCPMVCTSLSSFSC